ncbi:MAG: right-handed parallel beta-helix repeat-containing protein [candidate division Zixibacteria bacterium]|nr:right-handed parallel beta-helix repeat-containing protein [Candidatus Tariuqbacter arcticus]
MRKLLVTLVVAILISFPSFAAIIHIPGDYPTIQAGIDASTDGDTVLVADGTYTGDGNKDIDYGGKAILVISENGAEYCIINCEYYGRGFYFHSGESQTSILSGFRIINGYTAYFWPESGGGAIRCSNNSNPIIENCTFVECSGDEHGGAIYCNYSSDPTIDNCTFIDNHGYYGGGVYCSGTSPTIVNCIFNGNSAGENGGGICCFYGSNSFIKNCAFNNNSAMFGGGIKCWNNSSTTIENCILSGNSADRGGGIDCAYDCYPIIKNCALSGNSADFGAGINCAYDCGPTIENCTLSENSASGNGGGIGCSDQSNPAGVNNIIWDNTAPTGGQIGLETGSSFSCTYSDIQGGWLGTGNIDADPLFYTTTGDSAFFLMENSPCIDAGDPDSPFDPDGTIADMGAFYFDQSVGVSNPNFAFCILHFELSPVFPNPFNSTTDFTFSLPKSSYVEIKVYDLLGREVLRVFDGFKPAGVYNMHTEGNNLSSGIYFLRMRAGEYASSQKIILLK